MLRTKNIVDERRDREKEKGRVQRRKSGLPKRKIQMIAKELLREWRE
jgi:hypothetical protein